MRRLTGATAPAQQYAVPRVTEKSHRFDGEEPAVSQTNTRGTLEERTKIAVRDHLLEEEVFARQVEHMEPSPAVFSDAYIGGNYERPMKRSEMMDWIAANQKQLDDMPAELRMRGPGPHYDDLAVLPHPMRPYVLNDPPPQWIQSHPLRSNAALRFKRTLLPKFTGCLVFPGPQWALLVSGA